MLELGFVSAIVGSFTCVWMIIHSVAAIRWPETKSASSATQIVYRDVSSGSQTFSTSEVCE
jgi:hypothetical protein